MTTSSTETLSALERAHEVVPVLAEHAAETEAARRVHHASLAAVRDARFFALPVPQRFGGGGAGVAEVFAEVDTMFCGSGKPGGAAVSTLGGFRITGRWDYVSGAEDAAVAGLGVMLPGMDGDDTQATLAQALVPIDELKIDKTWDTAGLRGTGSHTLIAEDLFVPAERASAVEFSSSFVLASTAYVLAPPSGQHSAR
jgi:alkylation response protein AidB-like acyl-CoA dehydrogenase